MKVGDYVRTKDGYIYKIEDGEKFYEDSVDVGIGVIPDVDGIWVDKAHFQYVDKKEIVKTSPNIIDLIEVGDYVNGKKVLDVAIDYIFDYSEEIKIVYFDIDKKDYIYSKVDIKSIVTKQQFESMEYKI